MPLIYSADRKDFGTLQTCFDEQCCLLAPYQASPRMFLEAEGAGITVLLSGSQKYGTTEMTDAQHHREATAGMTSKKLTSRLAKRWVSKKVEPLMADSSGKCKGCYLSVNASGFSLLQMA